MNRAIFVDRDGTLCELVEYMHRAEDFRLVPGAADSIAAANRAGFLVFVVTNQSGVARGMYTEDDVERLNGHIGRTLAGMGASVARFYFCPHHPTEGKGAYGLDCPDRKPNPGMFLRAAREFDLDLASSFGIGDNITDVEAALSAGCRPALVRTGHGRTFEPAVAMLGRGVPVFDSLPDAVRWAVASAGPCTL